KSKGAGPNGWADDVTRTTDPGRFTHLFSQETFTETAKSRKVSPVSVAVRDPTRGADSRNPMTRSQSNEAFGSPIARRRCVGRGGAGESRTGRSLRRV